MTAGLFLVHCLVLSDKPSCLLVSISSCVKSVVSKFLTDKVTRGYRVIRVTTLQTMRNSLTIPWWFKALLRDTQHVKCYLYHAHTSVTVSGGGRNATVHDPKPHIQYLTRNRLLLNTGIDRNMKLTINSFRPLFPDKIFSLTFPWLIVKSLKFSWHISNSLTFPGVPDKWSPWAIELKLTSFSTNKSCIKATEGR